MVMTKTPEEIKKGLEYLSSRDPAKKFKLWQEGIAYDWQEDAAADALAYIQQLEARVPRWIPVEEKLPEKHKIVIVSLARGVLAFGFHYGKGWWCDLDIVHDEDVTHWCPLPSMEVLWDD